MTSSTAAEHGAETQYQRQVLAHRREVLQTALRELAPTHPDLYGDTVTLMRALQAVLAQELKPLGG